MNPLQVASLAEKIATEAHQGHFRRDGVTLYVRHPAAVASGVSGDHIAEAVAWLHDVLEDTHLSPADLIAAGLPSEVIERVVLLTKKDSLDYAQYLAGIKADPISKRVKIADMLSNLSDSPSEQQIIKYAKGLLILLT